MSYEVKSRNRSIVVQFLCDECPRRSRPVKIRGAVDPRGWTEVAGVVRCPTCSRERKGPEGADSLRACE